MSALDMTPILTSARPGTTLQINICADDYGFAGATCRALVETHRAAVDEVLLVVDCCAGSNADDHWPDKALLIREIANNLHADGVCDRVLFLERDGELHAHLWTEYFGSAMQCSFGYNSRIVSSYLAGLEFATNRYVVHFDGDMLLYQEPGFDWIGEARTLIDQHPGAVSATPLTHPPIPGRTECHEALTIWKHTPLLSLEMGWRSDWLSTRCFLLDRHKLDDYLPLIESNGILTEEELRRHFGFFPPTLEHILSRGISRAGGWQYHISDVRAWLLHPQHKPPRYLKLVPSVIQLVQQGRIPVEQCGEREIQLEAWERFIASVYATPGISLGSLAEMSRQHSMDLALDGC